MMQAMIEWLPAIAALAAAGAIGGLLAGLFGVGGGIVIVPALDLALGMAGVSPASAMHVAVATSMATIIPTSLSSSRSHAKRGAIDREVIRRWAVPIVAGSVAGSLLAARVDGQVLALVFALLALFVAVKMLLPLDHVVLRRSLPGGLAGAALPAAIGGFSAMVGIGGGTLSVPAMTLCGEAVHKAVGTAALLGLWISVPATLGYLLANTHGESLPPFTVGYVSLVGLALIAPLAWALAPLGARIAHGVSRRRLSLLFGAFLLLVAARMLYRALH